MSHCSELDIYSIFLSPLAYPLALLYRVAIAHSSSSVQVSGEGGRGGEEGREGGEGPTHKVSYLELLIGHSAVRN